DGNYAYLQHFFSILLMGSTVVFLFFLARFFYILGSKWNVGGHLERWDLAWKIPLGIVFPLLGLALNNNSFDRVFGDFSETSFYVLALLNGIFLCLPNSLDGGIRWVVFFLRLLTFPFIFYFFLVFLPFLPLSIPAIIIFGTGFLMMTPTALFMVQVAMMYKDYLFLKERSGKGTTMAVLVLGLSLLPLALFYMVSADRDNLETALDYVYAPDYEAPLPDIHPGRLLYTLENIKKAKYNNGRRMFSTSHYKPYLSNFYQWWVMENLTLADAKIRKLEGLFKGKSEPLRFRGRRRLAPESSDSVNIQAVRVESRYDEQNQNWRSWVHFEIDNPTKRQQEFNRRFRLPTGVWISNYYLDIEGRREYGILAEKKAAKWVYQQIVGQRRDPGILSYEKSNEVLFRVFPFAGMETRTTGIEFIHKYPLEWNWEGHKMYLGDSTQSVKREIQQVENNYFIPAERKAEMPLVKRKPYLHFLVDASINHKQTSAEIVKTIAQVMNHQEFSSTPSKFSLVNYQVRDFDEQKNLTGALKELKPRGG
ncbi:MAG: MSEP-CTERM sorting domain-containing protein, partial [Bacteroidota bacterium]